MLTAAVCGALLAAAVLLAGAPRPGRTRLRRNPRTGQALVRRVSVSASWRGRLTAQRHGPDPGRDVPITLVVDLVAAAVDAGTAPAAACLAVADALRSTAVSPAAGRAPGEGDLAADLERIAWGAAVRGPGLVEFSAVLKRAQRWGVAPGAMIRRCAQEERRRIATQSEAATNRLPVRLVLPAGLCLLPAALLLGVVPVVLDLVARVLR